MSRNSYAKIINFGPNEISQTNNPVTVCMNSTLDNEFNLGSTGDLYGQHSAKCQMFMSDYCAKNWDINCEIASLNRNTEYPNNIQTCGSAQGVECMGLTAGDILVQNTAYKKYLVNDCNCEWQYEPFDPTIANSPLVRYQVSNKCNYGNRECVPEMSVNPHTIDNDPVMNRILLNPKIGLFVLVNIYNTMKRKGTLGQLKGTKLGKFYHVHNEYFAQRDYKGEIFR